MILTAHTIVGSAVANLVPNSPVLGFVLAYGSHYLIDTIPHRDQYIDPFFDKDWKTYGSIFSNLKSMLGVLLIGGDVLIGIILSFIIFVRGEASLIATIVGIVGGVLPDFLQFLYYKFKKQPWIFTQKIHDFFHSKNEMKDKTFLGILSQATCTFVFIAVYFLFR